jgi:hypothetical protein
MKKGRDYVEFARQSGPTMTDITSSLPGEATSVGATAPMKVQVVPVITTSVAGWQLARYDGTILTSYSHHGWVVASIIVVGVMAVIAIGILEPANLGVLFELRKPAPDSELIGRLMRRFIYTAGITGAMQVATLVIMTRLATTWAATWRAARLNPESGGVFRPWPSWQWLP